VAGGVCCADNGSKSIAQGDLHVPCRPAACVVGKEAHGSRLPGQRRGDSRGGERGDAIRCGEDSCGARIERFSLAVSASTGPVNAVSGTTTSISVLAQDSMRAETTRPCPPV